MKRNIDLDWYEKKANFFLKSQVIADNDSFFENLNPRYHRPFLHFYELISTNIKEGWNVLEIGSGTGDHTKIILDTKASLSALDISPSSLEVLRLRYPTVARTVVGNMENMPFRDGEFDAVVSCGSLSYGNPQLVFAEIQRVLRPGGIVIILDTLASNPLFMLLRIRHVLLRRRSLSTLFYMPGGKRVKKLTKSYKSVILKYFVPFVTPLGNSNFKRDKAISSLYFKGLEILSSGLERSCFKFLAHKFTFIGTKESK